MPEGWGGSGVIEIDRVKTPALAFACRRESEIRDFVPAGYFEFAATAQAEGGTFWMRAAPTAGPDSLSREGAQAVLEGARSFAGSISGQAGRGQMWAPAPAARSTLAPEDVQRALRGGRDRHRYYL